MKKDARLIKLIETLVKENIAASNQMLGNIEPDPENMDNSNRELIGHSSAPNIVKHMSMGAGNILAPKTFVPQDAAQPNSNQDDADFDGIPDRVDPDKPPAIRDEVNKMDEARHNQRYGSNEPSGAQLAKKFKDTKKELMQLSSQLALAGKYDAAKELDKLLGFISRIEKQLSSEIYENKSGKKITENLESLLEELLG